MLRGLVAVLRHPAGRAVSRQQGTKGEIAANPDQPRYCCSSFLASSKSFFCSFTLFGSVFANSTSRLTAARQVLADCRCDAAAVITTEYALNSLAIFSICLL